MDNLPPFFLSTSASPTTPSQHVVCDRKMEQENVAMDTEVIYPVLLLPKRCTTLETECDSSENVFIDLNINSVDTEGSNMCIYSGYCNVKLVDNYDYNRSATIDFNQVPIIIDETPVVDNSFNQSQVWIDPVRSPNVYNHYEAVQALQNYSTNHQTRTSRITVEKRSTYITQNVYNYEESVRYSPMEEYEHKKFKKIQLSDQQSAQNTSIDQNNFNLYEDNEFECGVFLSQLSEDIMNENENRARGERRFSEMQSQNNALKQLMSPDIQSFSKQTKTILFFGHDISHGETIQKIGVNDPTVECSVSQYNADEDYDPASADPNQKKYQCEKCKRIFHQLYAFKEHMVGGHRRSPASYSPTRPSTSLMQFVCADCGKTLKTQEKFQEHCARHGDPELECDKCHKVFASKFTLRAHAKIHTRKNPCAMCFKSFSTKKELTAHMLKIHALIPCDKCDYYFSKYEDLQAHQLTHQDKHELIDTSETEFASSFVDDEIANEDFMIPTDNIRVEDKFEELDAQDMPNYDDLKNADYVIAKVMSNDIFQLRCKKSKRHRRTDKTCEVCQKVFDRIGDLKRHLIEHVVRSTLAKTPVSKDGTLTIHCEVCQVETFTKIDKYKAHLREHAKLTLYKCTFCDKSFSDSSNFSKHKKIHGVSYLQCDLCQRKFNSKKMITQHMEYHNRNPPITCDYCGKTYHFKSMLNKHIKTTHTREVAHRFRCRFCRECFKSLKEKWDHEWTVHKVRKIVVDCLMCGCKFRKYSELKRHCGNAHDMQIPQASKLLKNQASVPE